ncbi:MAG TPA: pyridoxamine 5'-phosphate oxidase family protein [Candidatus Binataceae bacterium]|nr:pyridoxamine 5'-phosphate oxidase family protein [Candidatus Binataceae bacterium]
MTALFTQEHVAVIVTQGGQWPTATLQAFAETDAMDLVFIMGADADKFQNLVRNPNVTVLVDTRDVGDVAKFQVTRASIQGIAEEVAKDGAQWEPLKAIFLKKNPFEAPFFGSDKLRMVRVRPKRISYAGIGRDMFKVEI